MATLFKKQFTKPLPPDAKIVSRTVKDRTGNDKKKRTLNELMLIRLDCMNQRRRASFILYATCQWTGLKSGWLTIAVATAICRHRSTTGSAKVG